MQVLKCKIILPEKRWDADAEHDGHKEEEEDVKPSSTFRLQISSPAKEFSISICNICRTFSETSAIENSCEYW
jgi:hypothetical protein